MEIVIHNLSNILAYIEDLLVHTKDHCKHLEILDELFTRLRKHGQETCPNPFSAQQRSVTLDSNSPRTGSKIKHLALYTDKKPVTVHKPVHVKTLHQ
jgi:hypothetical protein